MRREAGLHHWDDEQKMGYAVVGDQWVGFPEQRSMREKVKAIKTAL